MKSSHQSYGLAVTQLAITLYNVATVASRRNESTEIHVDVAGLYMM